MILKLQIIFLIQILSEGISAQIDLYLYCVGICTAKIDSNSIPLTHSPPPFTAFPDLYTAAVEQSGTKIYLKVEDYFLSVISGHITIDGFSFYIGLSDYFVASQSTKEYKFYDKNEPRLLQTSYVSIGLASQTIEIIFTIPIGKQLYEAQFPYFSQYCLSKFYYTQSQTEILIDFSEVFDSVIDTREVTFPSDFTGKVNGTTPTSSTYTITPSNSKLSITLGEDNKYIIINTKGTILRNECNGEIIVSSLQEGCESYEADPEIDTETESDKIKCTKCFPNFFLHQNGSCLPEREGYYILKDDYRQCYKSCQTCKLGGNDEVHNCEICKSDYPIIFPPDYRQNSNFCFKDCSSVGLLEQLVPNKRSYCSTGCRKWEGLQFDNKICVSYGLALGLGLLYVEDQNKTSRECPDQYPYLYLSSDNTPYCRDKCPNGYLVYIHTNNKKYCTKECPNGLIYVTEGKVCGPLVSGKIYYKNNYPNVLTTNCNEISTNYVNYKDFNNYRFCDFTGKENYKLYYDGIIKEFVNSCPSDFPYVVNGKCSKNYCPKFINQGGNCLESCNSIGGNFYYNFLTRECLSNCDSFTYSVKESENNFGCMNIFCPFDYPYLKDGKFCVNNCGENRYIGDNNKCVDDCQGKFIDLDTNKCVSDKGVKYKIRGTNKIIHQCQSIGYVIYIDPEDNNNQVCVDKCPDDAPLPDDLSFICRSECIPIAPFFNKMSETETFCTFSCNHFNKKILNRQCVDNCTEVKVLTSISWGFDRNIFKCTDTCDQKGAYCTIKVIENVILDDDVRDLQDPPEDPPVDPPVDPPENEIYTEFIPAFNHFIQEFRPPSFKRDEIKYENFTLQCFPIDDPYELTNYSTILSLNQCAEILKKSYGIDELFVFKGDRYRPDSGVIQVEYIIYDKDGNLLNLSLCNTVKTTIQYKLDKSIGLNLTLLELMMREEGIDILNSSSSFYTDICHPYTSSIKTDVILSDRRDEFFPNISLCDTGCEYGGVDIETMIINCNCNVKEEVIPDIVPPEKMFIDSAIKETNLWLFKCYKVFINLKNWKNNYGFYLIGSLELICIILFFALVCNFRQKKGILIALMMKNNFSPPRNIDENLHTGSPNEETTLNYKNDHLDEIKEVDYEGISFNEAREEDKRKICEMFFDIFSGKIDFFQVVCHAKELEFTLITVSGYLFNLILGFTTNAFFYSDDVISETHHNGGELSFGMRLLLSTLSNILSNAVDYILFHFIKYQYLMELFAEERLAENSKLMAIKRLFNHLKVRFFFYFFFKFIFSATCFYFIVIFCSVYRNSQINWLKDCLTGALIELVISLIISILVTFLRYISLKCGIERIYYIAIYINNWTCIISL